MKKLNLFVIILVSLTFLQSCSETGKDVKDKIVPVKNKAENIWVIESPLKKWVPSYDSLFATDTNNFIFLKEAYNDTCFLIYIKQQDSIARGMCYILLPELHRGFEDYQDKGHELLFFEGLSFKLGNLEWNNIKKITTNTIKQMSDSVYNKSNCLHCPYYNIIFKGSQRSTGNSQLQDEFVKYETLIRINIINKFLQQKKGKTLQ